MTTMTNRRGFTLLEVVISMAILIVICLIVFLLLFSSSSEGATQQSKVSMDGKVLETLNVIAEDIRNSGGVYTTFTTAGADTPLAASDYWFNINNPGRRYLLTMGQYSGFVVGKTANGQPGAAQYSDSVSYYWQPAFGEIPDNGIDDNHDGLIDEGDVIQVRTVGGVAGAPHKICRNVSPRGLVFEMLQSANPPQAVKVMLQVMGLDSKGKVMYSQSEITASPRSH